MYGFNNRHIEREWGRERERERDYKVPRASIPGKAESQVRLGPVYQGRSRGQGEGGGLEYQG